MPEITRAVAQVGTGAMERVLGKQILNKGGLLNGAILSFTLTIAVIILGHHVNNPFEVKKPLFERPWLMLLSINLVFDFLTIWVTYRILIIMRKCSQSLGTILILADILIAGVLTGGCVVLLNHLSLGRHFGVETAIAFASTVTFPTVIIGCFLVVMLIALCALWFCQRIVMYFLEIATESEATKLVVFTLFAVVINTVLVMLQSVRYLTTTMV